MKIKMFISEKANILLPGNKRKSRVQSLVPANITSEFGGWMTNYLDKEIVLDLIRYVDQIHMTDKLWTLACDLASILTSA